MPASPSTSRFRTTASRTMGLARKASRPPLVHSTIEASRDPTDLVHLARRQADGFFGHLCRDSPELGGAVWGRGAPRHRHQHGRWPDRRHRDRALHGRRDPERARPRGNRSHRPQSMGGLIIPSPRDTGGVQCRPLILLADAWLTPRVKLDRFPLSLSGEETGMPVIARFYGIIIKMYFSQSEHGVHTSTPSTATTTRSSPSSPSACSRVIYPTEPNVSSGNGQSHTDAS